MYAIRRQPEEKLEIQLPETAHTAAAIQTLE